LINSLKPKLCSQNIEAGIGLGSKLKNGNDGSIFKTYMRFYSSPKQPDWFCHPTSLPFNVNLGHSPLE
jgi:hypothetical protein